MIRREERPLATTSARDRLADIALVDGRSRASATGPGGPSAWPTLWHVARHRSIVRDHPDVRALVGHRPVTAGFVVALVVTQVAVAGFVAHAGVGILVVTSYLFGAFAVHGLGVLIHECAHNLVFSTSRANRVLSLVANLPLLAPGAIDFREKHLLHHKHLGQGPTRDFQSPTPEAVKWVGTSRWRKVVWLGVGSLIFPKRPIEGVVEKDGWRTANLALQVAFITAVIVLLGWQAVAYLGLSALFAFGPHPLGMRGYAEHVPVSADQPTASYYGWMNRLSFNVGYHTEHHDFPAVSWLALRRLHEIAEPHYRGLVSVRSWSGLLYAFVTRRELQVDSYVGSGSGAMLSASTPDQLDRLSGGVTKRKQSLATSK